MSIVSPYIFIYMYIWCSRQNIFPTSFGGSRNIAVIGTKGSVKFSTSLGSNFCCPPNWSGRARARAQFEFEFETYARQYAQKCDWMRLNPNLNGGSRRIHVWGVYTWYDVVCARHARIISYLESYWLRHSKGRRLPTVWDTVCTALLGYSCHRLFLLLRRALNQGYPTRYLGNCMAQEGPTKAQERTNHISHKLHSTGTTLVGMKLRGNFRKNQEIRKSLLPSLKAHKIEFNKLVKAKSIPTYIFLALSIRSLDHRNPCYCLEATRLLLPELGS